MCAGTSATVENAESFDRQLICNAAGKAESFFDRCGLAPKTPYMISVKAEIENIYGSKSFGNYNPSTGIVSVLSYAAAVFLSTEIPADEKTVVYRKIPPLDLYQSIVAHEVGHAIVHRHFDVPASILIYEYTGYALQISLMSSGARNILLREFRNKPNYPDEIFNDLTLSISPMFFAVAAYKHFMRPENGCGFVKGLLKGTVRFPQILPYF